MRQMINYSYLSRAEIYYKRWGPFTPINVPWYVSEYASSITKPEGATTIDTHGQSLIHGVLPASGEQSFIQMMIDGNIGSGSYQCTTPCFREEDVQTDFNRLYFMKNELIVIGSGLTLKTLMQVSNLAHVFFQSFFTDECAIVSTEDGFDIESPNGIELGSYGHRTVTGSDGKIFEWIYGTGCAEPRLSQSIDFYEENRKGLISI